MKRTLLATTLALTSLSVCAQTPQCDIRIDNEMHLKNESISVYQDGQPKVVIDQNNQVFINGEKVDLNQIQQQEVKNYREKVSTYVPRAKQIADDGVKLANEVIDDVSATFKNQAAFDNVKQAIGDFYSDIESRYYQNGEWVLKKDAVSQAITNWKTDSSAAMQRFNGEFFSSAFTVLSDKMKADGSVNLSELQNQLIDLKAKVENRLKNQSSELQKEANDYCTDLKGLAVDEKALHQQIPELKGYEVFVI
ncbi:MULTISPECIES: DUF2884 family protein [Vibrio]|uniref:DUF2884 family protein n=1 Tax=Vibrio casei TaxID=673372 RepID=A0A368LPE6_9VIBR|nr:MULTISPECIES: DUF2884 family protein [Vibrio]RCS73779.1 DUF2884 family protein [Vibrio casei]SJN34909.1 Methyl-accepting chemotaxis protein [Vibrio casei]HBV77327.1 DUF2884 domain-containing protein [Vibrio sp.]